MGKLEKTVIKAKPALINRIVRKKTKVLKSIFERKIEKMRDQREEALETVEEIYALGREHHMPMAALCVNCNREVTMTCAFCSDVAYCSDFCKRKDWPSHSSLCDEFYIARGRYINTRAECEKQ